MRALLFVPGDAPRKLETALNAGADALIVDLEDSVAASGKAAARRQAAAFLEEVGSTAGGPLVFVRVNALGTGWAEDDLAAVMPARPYGIVLPKAVMSADIRVLDAHPTGSRLPAASLPARRGSCPSPPRRPAPFSR